MIGVYHNLNEWRDGRDPGERPFARTLRSLGGFLNCQERALPVTDERLLEGFEGRRDVRLCNLGLVRGRLVLADYA